MDENTGRWRGIDRFWFLVYSLDIGLLILVFGLNGGLNENTSILQNSS